MPRPLILVAAVLALAACSRASAGTGPAESAPPLLLDSKGVIMPLKEAAQKIGFRPVVPTTDLLGVAVIPPLGNEDTQKTRGIAFEFESGGEALILSEWPLQNFRIAFGKHDASTHPCTPIAYAPDGVIWTTPHGVGMTLQPDGKSADIKRQARALIARGACR